MAGLRTLALKDVPQALELSSAEGWNQTDKDWEFLIQNPDNLCLAFEIDGKVIATATALKYQNDLAWIGMVLVHSSHRGKGISKLLLSHLLEKLKSCRCIKLDATPAGQPVYQKLGFREEYLVHRMTSDQLSLHAAHNETGRFPEKIILKNISEIIEYDKKIHGVNRSQLIEFLVKEYSEKCWVLKNNGKVEGFVLGRDGTRFHQIGPLVADSILTAKILMSNALTKLNGLPVVVDVMDNQSELVEWLQTFGLFKNRSFLRMHLDGGCLKEMTEKQFLISGPEFG